MKRFFCHFGLVILLGLGGGIAVWGQEANIAAVPVKPVTDRFERAQDLIREGKADAGIAMGRETLDLVLKRAQPEGAAEVLQAQQEMIQLYLLCHRFNEAEQLLQAVLREQERVHASSDLAVADALVDLAWFYSNLANTTKAEPLFLRALEINEKSVGRRHRRTADVLNGLGVLCENKGEYDRAERYFLEAVDIKKETLGADALSTANTVNNLATLYWSQGDYRRAEEYFSQALAVRERVKGRGSLPTATTLNNLALVYTGMGDYERAEPLFWRVLRIRERKLGVNHPLTLTTANHLGLLYYDLRDYKAAESFLQRAAQGREKTVGAEQPDTARAIFHLACLYDTMGLYAKAEPLHRRALDIRRRILGDKHPETAASFGFLARHYHLMGKLAEAEPNYQRALELQREAVGADHSDRLKTLENFACLEIDKGDRARAVELAREAEDIRERQLQSLFLFTSEKQRIDFQRTLQFYNLSASIGEPQEIARVVYRTKGVVLDSVVEDRLAAQATKDAETVALIDNLRGVSRQLDELRPSKEKDTADQAQRREALELEADRLQVAIGDRLNLKQAARRSLQVNPAQVGMAVPTGAVLVEFVRYQAYQGNLKFSPAYGALVQGGGEGGLLRWVPLGSADEIEKQIASYQKFVRRRVREAALSSVLSRLYVQVWKPVEAVLPSDCRRVIVSPDADLNYVSFATLLTTEDEFLCEKREVQYVSSGRDLLEGSRDLTVNRGQMAVFAAPDFGVGESRSTSDSSLRLPALPGARKEAASLMKLAAQWGWEANLYAGGDASEANLKSLAAPTILHLATHGFYWNVQPKVRRTEDLPSDVHLATAASVNPMKQSLLALSGAQATLDRWQRGDYEDADNDGLLAADEVGSLNLQGTWLVVLSACDTGLGQAQAGEGVLGLRRGFLLAGARNLLMTLWPVEDADTEMFMELFYAKAIPGKDAAAALSSVQKDRLVQVRKQKGLWQAVRSAGPFILSY